MCSVPLALFLIKVLKKKWMDDGEEEYPPLIKKMNR